MSLTPSVVPDGSAPAPVLGSVAETGRTRALLVLAILTALLAGAAAGSAVLLLVGVALAQALVVISWVLGTGMPGRIGALVIAAAGCAAADVSVSVWPHSALSPLLAPLGLAVPALFIHQLTRGVVRARVVESVSGTALILVTAIALSAFVQLRHEDDGRAMAIAAVLSAGVGLIAANVVDLVWSHPRFDADVPHGLPGLVVGILAGAGIGLAVLSDSTVVTRLHAGLVCAAVAALAALVGVGTGFVAHGLVIADVDERVPGSDPRTEFGVPVRAQPALRPIAIAIIPLALVAPVAYVLFLSVG